MTAQIGLARPGSSSIGQQIRRAFRSLPLLVGGAAAAIGCTADNPAYNVGAKCDIQPASNVQVYGWFNSTPRPADDVSGRGLSLRYVDASWSSAGDVAKMGVGCVDAPNNGDVFGVIPVSATPIDFSFTNGRQQVSLIIHTQDFRAPGTRDPNPENKAFLVGELSASTW